MEEIKGELGWYVVNTYSGHENKVKENLERRTKSMNLEKYISRIIVAEQEEIVTTKDGKQKTKTKNLYPGYVFVELVMTDEAWYMVRNTPGVTGLVGSSGSGTKPFPLPREQIIPILKRMGLDDPTLYEEFKINDLVRIVLGSFEGSEGTIESVDQLTGEVKISSIFFGRKTTIPTSVSEIEKI